MGHELHSVAGQSRKGPQGTGTFVLFPQGHIVAAPMRESWIGLGP